MVELKSRPLQGVMGPTGLVEGSLDMAMDAVVMVDESHRITAFNRGAEAIFGYAAENVIGRPFYILFYDLQVSEHSDIDRPIITSGSVIQASGDETSLGIDALRSNGEKFPVEISVRKLHQAGRPRYAYRVNDITERRVLERHVFETDSLKALEAVVDGIAHDFNNMLCAITSYTHLAQNVMGPMSRPQDYLEQVHRAAREADQLVRQLMASVQPHDEAPEEADLNKTFLDMKGVLGRIAGEENKLVLELSGDLPLARIRVRILQQMLINLIGSTRNALRRGGVLTVRTKLTRVNEGDPDVGTDHLDSREFCLVSVSLNGGGMIEKGESDVLHTLISNNEVGRRSFLGLDISRGIVTECGGFISVEIEHFESVNVNVYIPRV